MFDLLISLNLIFFAEIIKKDGYHHYIDDLSHLGEGFLLTVKGLKTYDGGYYQCIAENEFGSVSAAVRLELDISK